MSVELEVTRLGAPEVGSNEVITSTSWVQEESMTIEINWNKNWIDLVINVQSLGKDEGGFKHLYCGQKYMEIFWNLLEPFETSLKTTPEALNSIS
jgi:hypothetical protein